MQSIHGALPWGARLAALLHSDIFAWLRRSRRASLAKSSPRSLEGVENCDCDDLASAGRHSQRGSQFVPSFGGILWANSVFWSTSVTWGHGPSSECSVSEMGLIQDSLGEDKAA